MESCYFHLGSEGLGFKSRNAAVMAAMGTKIWPLFVQLMSLPCVSITSQRWPLVRGSHGSIHSFPRERAGRGFVRHQLFEATLHGARHGPPMYPSLAKLSFNVGPLGDQAEPRERRYHVWHDVFLKCGAFKHRIYWFQSPVVASVVFEISTKE